MEIGEIRIIAPLVWLFFYFCFPTNVFLIASRCNSRRKSITNHFDNLVKSFLFSGQFLWYINIIVELHCLTCSWQFHHQMKDDCRRENEIVMSKITFETTKKFIRFRGRLVLMHFIRCMHFKIYLWLFLPSLRSLGMRFIRRCLHDYNSRTTFNLLSISCL